MAVVGLLIVMSTSFASAQPLFGTLLATDKPETAHQKLKAMGYSGFSFTERASCKFDDSCLGTFTGPSVNKGFVRFSPLGIRSVLLETSSASEMVITLSRKYGTPSIPKAASGSSISAVLRNQGAPTHFWSLPTGVEISVGKDGKVNYFSPEATDKSADKNGLKNF